MDIAKKNSVLIVDDEKINLEILLKILNPDYNIYMTKSGVSAIEMARKFLPDIILLDIIMPDMNGFEVLSIFKKTNETKNIPVIFITGLNSKEDEEKGLMLEAADFIHKPFTDMNVKLRVRHQIQIVNQIRAIEQYAKDFIELNAVKAASEEKSKFFAKMSHEMRTPLNAVIGLSGMILEEGGLSNESWDNVEKISNAGTTLLCMVNDILDISKIESDKFTLAPVEYDTLGLINDAVTQCIMERGDKQIEFVLNIDENIPVRLYGDDIRIKQILNNLLSNAFKYTKEGTVELSIKGEISQSDEDDSCIRLVISVRDTGIGIPKENLSNMFSDYSQVNIAANRKIMGTGLGLSITKMILDMMNGTISVESEYGKGSVFTVKFPQKIVCGELIGTDVAKAFKNFQHISRKHRQKIRQSRISMPYAHVLVVDDVETNLHVARGMMKPYRMKVDCVLSGLEAINTIREEKVRYNAIFMDQMMPEMDGIEAVRIIRGEIGTEYAKTVPVIAFTANALAGNREMFLNNGFQDFLTKPIEIPSLDAVLRQWVRNDELEKSHADMNDAADAGSFFDPHTGTDRRSGRDRRKSEHHRLFEERIEGMDVYKGLERFGGDRDVFLQILRSFMKNTPNLLAAMNEVTKENLSVYAINVHGVKSSCRGISAEELGNKAQALETAAKAGNIDFVAANNRPFIDDALKLISNVKEALAKIDAGDVKKERLKKDRPYREALLRLQTACENYQADEIDAAINEIECFEYTADDGLAVWLRENIDQMNYMEIAEKIAKLP